MNPGFFGKIGSAGDFVSRGWSVDLRAALDKLFQQALHDMQQRGADLHALVDTAPAISLCVRPGVLFEGGLCGIVCLSQDRVGRVFPLTLGWQTGADSAPPLRWLPERVNVALLSAYYQALDGRWGPDELLGAVRRVDASALLDPGEPGLFATSDETLPRIGPDADHCFLAGDARQVGSAFGSLLAALSANAGMLGGPLTDQAVYSGFFVSRSFPPPPLLAPWFDQDWTAQPWKLLGAAPATAAAASSGDVHGAVAAALTDLTDAFPDASSGAIPHSIPDDILSPALAEPNPPAAPVNHEDEDGTRPLRWPIDTARDATDS